MRRKTTLVSVEDRAELEAWTRAPKGPHALRARIVLAGAAGLSARQIALDVGVAELTVYKWTRRFRRDGLRGLSDRPRSGQPKKLSKTQVQYLTHRTRHTLPPNGIAWTIRSFARDAQITEHQVRSLWAAARFDPRRVPIAIEAFRWSGRALVPRGVYLAAACSVAVFETHIRDARGTREVRAPAFSLAALKGLRNRADGLYAACDVLVADGAPSANGLSRLREVLCLCTEHSPAHMPLHVVLCADPSLTEAEIAGLVNGSNIAVAMLSTLDAWVAAIEATFLDLERRRDGFAERVLDLRRASARFTRGCEARRAGPRGAFSEERAFVWLATSDEHERHSSAAGSSGRL